MKSWCIAAITPTFLQQMEWILGIYARPYDPMNPVWCFDERPCMLIGDKIIPLPLEPGKPKRQNYEYERHGVCSLLLAVQPHTGLCFVQVRERRTSIDYAHFMQAFVDSHCPDGGRITLVQDNLNTHTPTSFYKAFTPDVAFDLMNKIDMNFTPKKASWLNMAEIQLSVLSRQCLHRRLSSFHELELEVLTWVCRRNLHPIPISWQFTPELARDKFHRFYPNLS